MKALAHADIGCDLMGRGLWDILATRSDAATLVADVRATFPLGLLSAFPQQHLPARFLQRIIPCDTWDSYWKFAVVRNPWDLVVSTYHYQKSMYDRAVSPLLDHDFASVIHHCRSFDDFARLYPAIRSDMTSLLEVDGTYAIDFTARIETLQDDIATISDRLGVPLLLPRHNESDHSHYREYYSRETKQIVANHFARDIDRFGYRF